MSYPNIDYARRPIRDVNQVGRWRVYAIGLIGGLAVLACETLFRGLGWPTPNLELLIGSLITGDFNLATWELGAVTFLALSACSAFAYSFIFWSAHRSGPAIGMNLSFFHWVISGVLAGLLPIFHPLLKAHPIYAPGFFWIKAGFQASVLFFAIHLIYGAVVGALFDWAAQRKERPQPMQMRRQMQQQRS